MTEAPYHRTLVILHWLLAVLIITALIGGTFFVAPVASDDPAKLSLLRFHMASGMFIFALMLVRFIVRLKTTSRAARADVHGLETFVHYAFYAAVLAMAVTGMTTALQANLNEIVFASSGAPLPATLTIYTSRIVHRYVAMFIVGLLVVHLATSIANHRGGTRSLARMSLRTRD